MPLERDDRLARGRPVDAVDRQPGARFSLSCRWTALTASPVLPGLSPTISFAHVVVADDPLTVRPFAAWKALTASTVAAPKMPSMRDADAVGAEEALDRPAHRRRGCRGSGSGTRGRRRPRPAPSPRAGGPRRRAARGGGVGMLHGAASEPVGSARRSRELGQRGGSAPGRWQVRPATATANATASRTAAVSARSSPPAPRSIQRARNPPPKASPAPTVSTTATRGIATSTTPGRPDDEDRARAVGDEHDATDRDRGWPAPLPPAAVRGEVRKVVDADLDDVGARLRHARAGRDRPLGRGSPAAGSSDRA